MSHSSLTRTLDFGVAGERDCVIAYDYTRGYPGVHTLRNGDPGYPDEPAELDITDITVDGKSIDYLFDEDAREALADDLLETVEDDARIDDAEAKAEWQAERAQADREYEQVYG